MKQTLGKIFLILFLTINSIAEVKVSVSSPSIYKGDTVNFIITADGQDITFPQIDEIEENYIIGTSSSQSTNIINGDITRTTSKTYSFRPEISLTIPSFSVMADGKSYQTKTIEVSVVKPKASQDGADFVLEMSLDKQEAYVGEGVDLTITFKRKINARAEKLQLGEPELENFWVKKIEKVEEGREGDYVFQKIHYLIFPQKSGAFTIPAIEALVGKSVNRRRGNDPFFNDPFFASLTRQLSWQKVFSNEPSLQVNPLPNGLELYGNYQIEAHIDKQEVKANRPVNLTISIKGEGNIDDIKKFDISINNTIIYADEPQISSKLVHNIHQGEFIQKIAMIGDQNFTIPSLTLEYFDKATKQVKTIQTKAIDINVIGGVQGVAKASSIEVSPTTIIQAQEPQEKGKVKIIIEKENAYIKYLFLLMGLLLGVGVTYAFYRLKNRVSKQEHDKVKAIKKAKNDRDLFDILLPYAKKNPVIAHALNRLEENLYRGGKHKIDKEELMEIFE